MKTIELLSFALALWCAVHASPPCLGATLCGRVVKVSDGDTVTVLDAAKAQHRIRLNAIDAPEKSQAFGQKSKERLSSLVFGKDITATWKSKDKYGRILGTVFVGPEDINLAMVRDGFAWHYRRFDNSPAYAAAEAEARRGRLGLWRDSAPIPPWEFRRTKNRVGRSATNDAANGIIQGEDK